MHRLGVQLHDAWRASLQVQDMQQGCVLQQRPCPVHDLFTCPPTSNAESRADGRNDVLFLSGCTVTAMQCHV